MLLAMIIMATMCGCREDARVKQARELLKNANEHFESKQYDSVRANLDELAATYTDYKPSKVEQALISQMRTVLKAQEQIKGVDSLLQEAQVQYNAMKMSVDEHKAAGCATAGELTSLTRMRLKRDSLKTEFDKLCYKVMFFNRH